jgi:hypothetical protein
MRIYNPFASKKDQFSDEPTIKVVGEGASAFVWLRNNVIERVQTKGDKPRLVAEVVSEAINSTLNKIDSENPGVRVDAANKLLALKEATAEGHILTIRGKVFTVLPEHSTE